MPSAEENTQLLWLIVSQKLVDGQLTAMDWAPIATGLGLEKAQAAQLRWSRLKKELSENNGLIPTKSTPVKGAKKAAAPKVPKAKKEKDPNATPKKRTPKKRKVEEMKDEDDEVEEALSNKDVDEIDDQDSQEIEPEEEDA